MTVDHFRSELQRMARANQVPLGRVDSVISAIGVGDQELFVNVFGADSQARRNILLVTSTRTCHLYRGIFGTRVRWTVLHRELEDVRPARSGSERYVVDSVVLEARGDLFEFRIAFNNSTYQSETLREIAAENAAVAAAEIRQATQLAPVLTEPPDPEAHSPLERSDNTPNYFSH